MLGVVNGSEIDMKNAIDLFPIQLTSVNDYARNWNYLPVLRNVPINKNFSNVVLSLSVRLGCCRRLKTNCPWETWGRPRAAKTIRLNFPAKDFHQTIGPFFSTGVRKIFSYRIPWFVLQHFVHIALEAAGSALPAVIETARVGRQDPGRTETFTKQLVFFSQPE